MKKIISGILALSMISGMSGFQNVCAVESDSEITISDTSIPSGKLEKGSVFNLRGNISSKYNLKKVDAEICRINTDVPIQNISVFPESKTYSIYPDIDYAMMFNELETGRYTYILNAEDISGYKVNLIKSDFQIGDIANTGDNTNPDGASKKVCCPSPACRWLPLQAMPCGPAATWSMSSPATTLNWRVSRA